MTEMTEMTDRSFEHFTLIQYAMSQSMMPGCLFDWHPTPFLFGGRGIHSGDMLFRHVVA